MIRSNKILPLLLLLSSLLSPAFGQEKNEDLEAYKEKVKQLVQFFEYTLNLVGSDTVPNDEKEAVLKSSYLKVFRDDKVQVEDDLDQRLVVTNKNIKSYLQDVDYFFKWARFSFDILDISYSRGDKNIVYYKVTLNRNLKGVTINGERVQNNKRRYIELNLDTRKKDLKIVSIYTTGISPEADLATWWKALPYYWKEILARGKDKKDTLSHSELKLITETRELDISGNTAVTTLEPLSKLDKLITLNASGTGISDIIPAIDLNELEVLNISNTPVSSITPLKYLGRLKQLVLSGSKVSSIEPLSDIKTLEHLDISGTAVSSLAPVSAISNLRSLKLSYTPVGDLKPVQGLSQLRQLDFSHTPAEDLSPLSDLKELEELSFSNTKAGNPEPLQNLKKLKTVNFSATPVGSLKPFTALPALEKIYCDNTRIDKKEIITFIQNNPRILIVYQSEVSGSWWNALSADWKKAFSQAVGINGEPGNEQLAAIIKLDSLNISGYKGIKDLTPIRQLVSLRTLLMSNTGVRDLKPLDNIQSLAMIDFSGTEVSDLSPLKGLKNLKMIRCNNTRITQAQVDDFLRLRPGCLIIFQTQHLSSWWNALDGEWKKILSGYLKTGSPNEEQLHKLINRDSLSVCSVSSLGPLSEFRNLKKLEICRVPVTSIDLGSYSRLLQHLSLTNMPLADIKGLDQLRLRFFSCSNTAFTDLKKIPLPKDLEHLDCSGTRIKSLKPLAGMSNLKTLNCSNTRVCSLRPLEKLTSLHSVSCFNTRISAKKAEKFRKKHPGIHVEHF